MPTPDAPAGIDRRTFMGLCSAVGLGGGRLPSALWKNAAPVLEVFGEADLLAVGEAYQAATDFHRRRPQKFA